jgi:hypothetical protein
MHEFIDRLHPNDRVLLVGDTRQHESVEVGRIFAQLQSLTHSAGSTNSPMGRDMASGFMVVKIWCVAGLLAALSAMAEVSITATLTDGTGTIYRTAYLHFQLVNCGQNIPVVPSQPGVIVQGAFDLRPSPAGTPISGSVLGNDQILCGNVASTYYVLTPMKAPRTPGV